MSAYNPPIENVPIFDSALFRETNSETALTPAQADKRYLRFPIAQGNETLQGATITGALVANSTSTFNGNTIINNQTLDIDGGSGQIRFADNTTQNSSYTGAGALAGSYTESNITIDANGKITAISNGTSTIPANLTPNSVVITPTFGNAQGAGIINPYNTNGRISFSGSGGNSYSSGVNLFSATTQVQFDFNNGGNTTPSGAIMKYRITFTFYNSSAWGQTSCLIDFYPNRWTQGQQGTNQIYNINNKINGNANYVYTDATYAPSGRQYWTYQQQFSGLSGANACFIAHNGYWDLYFGIPDNTYTWSGCVEALDTTAVSTGSQGISLELV